MTEKDEAQVAADKPKRKTYEIGLGERVTLTVGGEEKTLKVADGTFTTSDPDEQAAIEQTLGIQPKGRS